MTHVFARHDYAASLSHIGTAFEIAEWGCSVLVRPIANEGFDAIGCYPIAVVDREADLSGGLQRLREAGIVSVTLVLDDVHRPPIAAIEIALGKVTPYKTHYTVDPLVKAAPGRHHRRKLKQANRLIEVRPISLADYLESWTDLYDRLRVRHRFAPIHCFSPEHFEVLARLEGVHTIGGFADGDLVCAHIWTEHEGYVFSHLTASNDRGYQCGAAYAVNAFSLDYFCNAKLINLGGTAGIDEGVDGLARFKTGFANSTSRSWLATAILDQTRYADLAAGLPASSFFPAYRQPGSRFVNG